MTNQAEPFPFVNLSEPKEGKNEELRKLVRSNAMRSYRQKQKQKAMNPSTPQTSHIVHLPINDQPHYMTVASRGQGTSGASLNECGYLEWAAGPQSTSLNDPASGQSFQVSLNREGQEQQDSGLGISRVWYIPGTKLLLTPRNPSGGGLDDPFDVLPTRGDRSYNSRLLNHCRC